ncbi:recombination-associated protein RdgC [Thiosocius teredinicola]|uniref:recombination-associated protein RdgC n=1 Tax=Thiosocius teredinicola TaxID=1973002 RepID=UPI0009910C93
MWFRNLQLYRLSEPFGLDPEALHETLQQHAFKPCAGLDTHRVGWVPPAGRDATQLVHATAGRLMICLRREDRILPAAVIREHVEEKAEAIAEAEARPVGRKEKQRIKEEVIVDLLPRAFTRSSHLYAYIDPKDGWIVIDSGTAKKAEELLSTLRETLGSLRAKPLAVQRSPAKTLTQWLEKKPAREFVLGDECELKEPVDNGGVMRGKRIDVASAEVKSHLDTGMMVAKLAVDWQERISCLLCDDLGIRRLRFLDLVMEQAAEVDADDALARFDADFALMSMELANFLPAVVDAFGGLDED